MLEKDMQLSGKSVEGKWGDLKPVPSLFIANRHLRLISGFEIGQRITVKYSLGQILITKSNQK
jgi:hypothetical protein